jgi:uncharacterized protein YcbK (DUF882 family)
VFVGTKQLNRGERLLRAVISFAVALTSLVVPLVPVATAQAASGDRELYLYYTHTKETARITFRRNGHYDQAGLKKLNQFLRDWRRDEPTKMDPALFDLIWEVYQEVGAKKPIHVVSAYRAPATNEMLRSKSSAVAKNSRHTMGMAMDFFIPGIPISKLREVAMSKQVGGVGYYPTSGSPFVHLDTGNVRAWPRMTRAQLQKVFPDGKTLHLPTDGNPLSQSGYQYAKAQWVKCHTVPCSARSTSGTRVAQSGNSTSSGSGGTLFGWLFGDEADDDVEDTAPVARTVVASAPTIAPVPAVRPASLRAPADLPFGQGSDPLVVAALAPQPASRPDWLGNEPQTLSADITPAPSIGNRRGITDGEASPVLTAYAPAIAPEPDALRAVQMLAEQRVAQEAATAKKPAKPNLNTRGLRVATASTAPDLSRFGDLLRDSMKAVGANAKPAPVSPAPSPMPALTARAVDLFAPDLEHVTDIFLDPSSVSSERYAVIFDRDQGDFSPKTELGVYANRVTFSNVDTGPHPARFDPASTLLLASR